MSQMRACNVWSIMLWSDVLFVFHQANLLNFNECEALPPKELHSKIGELLKCHPNFPEAVSRFVGLDLSRTSVLWWCFNIDDDDDAGSF